MRFTQAPFLRGALGILSGVLTGFVVGVPIAIVAHDVLPVMSIVSPFQNQTVGGYVTFFSRSDSAGIVGLQFQVDGKNVGSEITSGTCRAIWDSKQTNDGLHTIQAVGRDQFGNLTLAQPVSVLVSNPVFVPPPPGATPTPTPEPTPAPPPPILSVAAPLAGAVLSGATNTISTIFSTGSQSLSYSLRDRTTGVTRWSANGPALAPTATSSSFTADVTTVPAGTYNLVVSCLRTGSPALIAEVPVTVAPSLITSLATMGGRNFVVMASLKLNGMSVPGVRVTFVVTSPQAGVAPRTYTLTTDAQGIAMLMGQLSATDARGTYKVTTTATVSGITSTGTGTFVN